NTKDTIKRLSEILVKMKSSGFSEIIPDLIAEFVDCVDNHVGDDDIVLMHICKPASTRLLDNDLFRDSIENLLIRCSDHVFDNNVLKEAIPQIIKHSDRESSIVQTCLE